MTNRFSGQVALVTGAAQGIGLATAGLLAEQGARVVLCDLSLPAAQHAAAALQERHHVDALGLACDVAEEAPVAAMVAAAVQRFGAIDILVNNAGVTRDNLLFKMSVADWDQVMGVHLRGTFLCTREEQKVRVPRSSGKIVNM